MSSSRRIYLHEQAPSTSSALVADNENDEDDDDEEEDDDEDPYNKPNNLLLHHYLLQPQQAAASASASADSHELQQQQYAYDSMSTILEVDSENSDESSAIGEIRRRGLLDSPLIIRTQQTPEPANNSTVASSGGRLSAASSTNKSSLSLALRDNNEEGRVSPVNQDRFSGALSALAQQVERLRRQSIRNNENSDKVELESTSKLRKQPKRNRKQLKGEALTSSSELSSEDDNSGENKQSSDRSSSPSSGQSLSDQEEGYSKRQKGGSPAGQLVESSPSISRPVRPSSRAASAESLMMISVSPMASPRIKFPLLRSRKPSKLQRRREDDDQEDSSSADDDERRLVEVSNKSTITAIDLTLMDKMIQKYFVDTQDKATQSIKFDCKDDEEDEKDVDDSLGRRMKKPIGRKSVAVGTEKFSRERFSLLPPTTTRSTQTKPNMDDNDIGTSETRRYKLSHHLFGPVIRRKQQEQKDVSTEFESSLENHDPNFNQKPPTGGSSTTGSETPTATNDTAPTVSNDTLDTSEGTENLHKNSSKKVSEQTTTGMKQQLQQQQQQQQVKEVSKSKQEKQVVVAQSQSRQQQTSPEPTSQQQQRPVTPISTRVAIKSSANNQQTSPISASRSNGATPEVSLQQQKLVSPIKSRLLLTPTRQVQSVTPDRDSLINSPEMVELSKIKNSDKQSGDSLASSASSSHQEQTQSPNADIRPMDESSSSSSSASDSSEETTSSSTKSDSLTRDQVVVNDKKGAESLVAKSEDSSRKSPTVSGNRVTLEPTIISSRATIPSLKTELRVIIEFNDSRQRQRSEVTSESQFIDGKLSKKTEVSTSKQVVASPREIYNKLQSIGREHSLIYKQQSPTAGGFRTSGAAPAAVAAANQNALRSLSMSSLNQPSPSSGRREEEKGQTGSGFTSSRWREVSRSSVRNEIETDTRSRRNQRGSKQVAAGDVVDEDIVVTSAATINHDLTANTNNGKEEEEDGCGGAKIELRSRALRRRELLERDPKSGQLTRSGRINEQTLVDSEAGFDENKNNGLPLTAEKKGQPEPEVADRQPVAMGARKEIAKQPSDLNINDSNPKGYSRRRHHHHHRQPPSDSGNATSGGLHEPKVWNGSGTPDQGEQHYPPSSGERETSAPASPLRNGNHSATTNTRKQQQQSLRSTSSARLEIDEHREDRRQVTKNGQVIFDDRLRERRYESQKGGSPAAATQEQHRQQWAWRRSPTSGQPLSPTMLQFQQQQQHGGSASVSPRTPTMSPTTGILRPSSRQQQQQQQHLSQRQLLKPISLRNNTPTSDHPHHHHHHEAPILFADQTSNLSSDPETMDSGFAQSGVGSGSALNQAHRQQQLQNYRHRASASDSSVGPSSPFQQQQQRQQQHQKQHRKSDHDELEQPESLNFVDDDVDELIDQLDNSSRTLLSSPPSKTTKLRNETGREEPPAPLSHNEQPADIVDNNDRRFLISPPPAFCSSEPANLNKLDPIDRQQLTRATKPPSIANHPHQRTKGEIDVGQKSGGGKADTALTTKLTRTKAKLSAAAAEKALATGGGGKEQFPVGGSSSGKRTMTKLEQNLVAPGTWKVVEKPNSSNTLNKPDPKMCHFKAQVMFESDTDSMSTERHSVASSRCCKGPKELISETKFSRCSPNNQTQTPTSNGEALPGQAEVFSKNGPNWDYSLRVNRMRGKRIDSKVNTYIKHSRQPLINSEAS